MTGDLRMLVSHLNQPETYTGLLQHEMWKQAFAWLQAHQENLPADGEYPLIGQDMRALVQTVTTKPRDQRVFEAHQREIDLQCCFDGSEVIEWAPVSSLSAQDEYNAEKDYTLFDIPRLTSEITMIPGTFAVFFPGDGHMPGVMHEHTQTRKVVIKIDIGLLQGKAAIEGPYDTMLDLDRVASRLMAQLIKEGQCDKVSHNIHLGSFPFTTKGEGKVWSSLHLVNLGRKIHNNDVPAALRELGHEEVEPVWVLALNAQHPHLMDNHIIITTKDPWTGPEDAPEVICLHKDAGKRRLRTHYADTEWGPHIWFATRPIA